MDDGLSTSVGLLWDSLNGSIYDSHPFLHALLRGWVGGEGRGGEGRRKERRNSKEGGEREREKEQ